ncbi:MAG: argininosuccinate synthase [Chloroflexota bacterium]
MRFDVAVRALDPRLEVIAPMRVGIGLSRDQEIAYARERARGPGPRGLPPDQNLWGRSIETGALEDPGRPRPRTSCE